MNTICPYCPFHHFSLHPLVPLPFYPLRAAASVCPAILSLKKLLSHTVPTSKTNTREFEKIKGQLPSLTTNH